MHNKLWRLQLFADGGDGGASGGEGGAESGVTPAAAGQEQQQPETLRDRLRKMGVPEDKLQNRAYDAPANQRGTPRAEPEQTADAAQGAEGENPPQQQEQKKPTWREIMQDPDYNAEMNKTVQRRLSKFKAQSEAMEKLSPALEMLAKHYGMDPERMDYDALARQITDDDSYYQQRAIDMGVSVDVAKKLDAAERLEEARRRDAQMSEQDRQIREHLAHLEEQATALREKFPDFDLQTELQNDAFARMTVPGSGLSVEDAYFAVHREDILNAARQAVTRNVASSIQAGQQRPNEMGAVKSANAPAKDLNSIRSMPKERRDELIRRASNGERITPEMLYG